MPDYPNRNRFTNPESMAKLMSDMISNGCTIAGWFWYCDLHDTHGNADSEDEAEFIAEAHLEFHHEISFEAYKDNLEDDEVFDPNYEVETCPIEVHHMNGRQ